MPWKPGQSGNPNGRPKRGDTIADEMRKLLAQEVEDPADPTKTITRKQLYVEALYRRAVNGDSTAMRLVWDHIDGRPTQALTVTQQKPTFDDLMHAMNDDGADGGE